MPNVGWGSSPWGGFPWGLGGGVVPSSAQLSEAIPIAENVIQLFFTADLEFSGLLGENDAGDPTHYTVTPDLATIGSDGLVARPIGVILSQQVQDDNHTGTVLNLTLDRPMSPYPGQYIVTVQNLITLTSVLLTPANATATFFGTRMPEAQLATDQMLPTRDFAHPDTLSAALDPLPNALDPVVLGSFPVGSDGDYAIDQGLTNLKKRIFRRLSTTKGRFLHLGNAYGVGIQNFLKMLALVGIRQQMADEAKIQIEQEPDVKKALVKVVMNQEFPELSRLVVLVRPTVGKPVRFDAPLIEL